LLRKRWDLCSPRRFLHPELTCQQLSIVSLKFMGGKSSAHVQLRGLWRNVRKAVGQERAAFLGNLSVLYLGCHGLP